MVEVKGARRDQPAPAAFIPDDRAKFIADTVRAKREALNLSRTGLVKAASLAIDQRSLLRYELKQRPFPEGVLNKIEAVLGSVRPPPPAVQPSGTTEMSDPRSRLPASTSGGYVTQSDEAKFVAQAVDELPPAARRKAMLAMLNALEEKFSHPQSAARGPTARPARHS